MLKALGAVFGAGMAVTAGSYLLVPMMVVAVLFTLGEGISRWWPFLLGLLIYSVVLAIVIAIIPSVSLKALLLALAGLAPPLYLWSTMGRDWTAASVAAFVAATVIGLGLLSLSASGLKLHGLKRYGPAPSEKKRLYSVLDTAGGVGHLALVQNLWLAPTAVMFLTYPNVLALIAALLGGIATFFAAEGSGF
ncbi:hypothetical protein [Paenarthrobacter sp. C1]|uniref:hypothetical protein n=1 Tax=Paenarthrobacter sp. C1 TaxID=3400220 RepID=UPI003BF560B9